MKYLIFLSILTMMTIIIYRLVPILFMRFSPLMQELRYHLPFQDRNGHSNNLLTDFLIKLRRIMQRAGIDNSCKIAAVAVMYLVVPLLLIAGGNRYALVFILFYLSFLNSYFSSHTKKRNQHYRCLLYKIYRFINMELEAGLILGDIIISLPDSVSNKALRASLEKMAAAWQLTGDIDLSVRELEHLFGTHETQLLANNLRQCLMTGVAGKSFAQMENLLFSRYVELIRRRSNQLKNQLLVASILAIFPIMVLMLWPVISEMLDALASVFS